MYKTLVNFARGLSLSVLTLVLAVCVVGWSSATAGANDDDHSYGPAIVRVAAVQINSVLFDNAANLANILARTEEAAANGAQLIVFPECATTGYRYINVEEALPYGEQLPGTTSNILAAKARELGLYIVYGVMERAGINLYDAAALVGPEGFIGKYRKAHMGFQSEALLFTRDVDSGFPVFRTAIGRIALGICYDGTLPETVRVPALRGVDIFAFAYSGGGGSTTHYMLSRAEENKCYVVQSARLGPQRLGMADGYSGVFAPGWKTLAMASKSLEEIVYADVDLSLLSRSWRHARRPAFYGPVAERLPREIQSMELTPEAHVVGNSEDVYVRIVTASVQMGLPVQVQFLLDGAPVVQAGGRLHDNTLTLPVRLPPSLPAGAYTVRVTINGEQSLTREAPYTVKAFPYPHQMGYLPVRTIPAATKSTIYVAYDMDVVPSTTVPATLTGGGSTFNLVGSINVAADGAIDNRLAIPYPTLLPSTTYTVTIPQGAVKTANGAGNDPFLWTFTTARTPLMVKTAVAQTNPIKGGNAANLEAMLARLDEAKAGGAKLVVFPELALSGAGFASKPEALPFAEEVPGPAVAAMAARAQQLGLYAAFGLLEEAPKPGACGMRWGRHRPAKVLYSTFVLVGPEGLLGKYRKVHLSQAERNYLEEGDIPFPTIQTASIGKIGLMLGDDVRFPEVARVHFVQGANIIATGGNVSDAMWREMILNRSSENLLYLAAANRIGSEGGVQYAGNSFVSGLYRMVAASAGPSTEALVMADLNIDTTMNRIGLLAVARQNGKRYAISYMLDRRPELYRPLIWDNRRGSHDR